MSFGTAVPYATNSNPYAIATADFNKDGKLDLVTTRGYDEQTKVSVRLGNGTGGFGAATEFPAMVWNHATYLFTGDLNNDTKPDLMLSDGINGYSTLMGNGDGTFKAAVNTFGAGIVAVQQTYYNNTSVVIGLADWIDGDWATHVQIQYGNAQGVFVGYGQDGQYWGPGGLAPVDLNNDGNLEVVTGEGTIFQGFPNGSLFFDWNQAAPLYGGVVATGDFTGDGKADVVVANGGIAVMRSRGDGTLDAPILNLSYGVAVTAVATADFNADGKLDVVVTDVDKATATVMLGNGDGTLRFGGAFAVGASPSSVTVGDFNRDGRPDVAVANSGTTNFSVLLNDGNWTNLPPPPPPPPTLTISDTSLTEGNTGTRNAAFTVTLSKAAAADVTVYYGTQSGTAAPQEDYSIIGGSITIPAGKTSGTINIAVVGDRIPEPNETFFVNINGATNAIIVDAHGIGTIIDDDRKKWVGPGSGGNWSTASNWSPSGVPTSADLIEITGTSVSASASAAFANLTLDQGASVSFSYSGTSPIGSWNGSTYTGITGMIQSHRINSVPNPLTAIGVAPNAGAVLVRHTFAGDANLDGKLNVDDYGRIDLNISMGTTGWFNGDFNYDGKINVDDYGIIDFNVGIQGSPLPSAPPPRETVTATSGLVSPLSTPVSSVPPAGANRDVFDSIFSTAGFL